MARRILVFASHPSEGERAARDLSAGDLEVEICAGPLRLVEEIAAGAGLLVLDRENLGPDVMDLLEPTLRAEPSWSSLPILLRTKRVPIDLPSMGFSADRDVVVLESPVSTATLLSTARSALRSRFQQYRIRDLRCRVAELEETGSSVIEGIEHELRNPLAAIRTNVELMRRSPGADHRRLERILRQVDRLTHRIGVLRSTTDATDVPTPSGEAGPRESPRAVAGTAESPRSTAAGPGRKPKGADGSLDVLVVEDLDDTRRALGEFLELCGHRVELAADGRAGLERLLESSPDVALVDLDLPKIDGYEVARIASRRLPGVGLVAITGFGSAEVRARALDAGFDLHLVKPVQPDQLESLLADRAWRGRNTASREPGPQS